MDYIKWFNWKYSIDIMWNVYSHCTNRYLKISKNKDWYYVLHVGGKFKLLHRLIAETYIPNPQNLATINHKNWNKIDNSLENLERMSGVDNVKHYWNILWWYSVAKKRIGKDNKTSIAILQINPQTKESNVFFWIRDAERILWIDKWNIKRCCEWTRKTAWWYIWEYINK